MRRQFSSGGVVFKKIKTKGSIVKTFWLVAKSNPSKDYPQEIWRMPKGWLDDEDNGKNPGPFARGEEKATEEVLREAALREVREEGGVEAKIIKKIGTERFFFKNEDELIQKFVTYYLMEWVKDLPEGPGFETEKVEWLGFEDARKKLTHSGEKKVLDKAKEILDSESSRV